MQTKSMTESSEEIFEESIQEQKRETISARARKSNELDPDSDRSESPREDRGETEEELARQKCRDLNALCAEFSKKVETALQEDIEFESLVSSLQAATVEYDELSTRLKHKRKTGELTRHSNRRLHRARKEVKKHRENLNVFMFYHDINLLLLESPQSYACMLCQNRVLIETENGEQVCRLRLDMSTADVEE